MTAPLPSAEILVCVLHVVPWPLGARVMSSDYDIGNLIVYDGDFFFGSTQNLAVLGSELCPEIKLDLESQ
jgi:hypothetical protein